MKKAKKTQALATAEAGPETTLETEETGVAQVADGEEAAASPAVELAEDDAPVGRPASRRPGVDLDDDIPEDALPPARPDPILSLRLSSALHSKLIHQAREEGIEVEALAQEMLAESVVLRAWEIAERKSAMRGGGQTGSQPPQGHGNHRHFNHHNGNKQHLRQGQGQGQGPGGNSRPLPPNRRPNNAWMEDKAAFLEYVRNQEKRGRR